MVLGAGLFLLGWLVNFFVYAGWINWLLVTLLWFNGDFGVCCCVSVFVSGFLFFSSFFSFLWFPFFFFFSALLSVCFLFSCWFFSYCCGRLLWPFGLFVVAFLFVLGACVLFVTGWWVSFFLFLSLLFLPCVVPV